MTSVRVVRLAGAALLAMCAVALIEGRLRARSLQLQDGGQTQNQTQSQAQTKTQGKTAAGKASGMTGMKMPAAQSEEAANPDAAKAANDDMSHMSMDMNPHMFMTALRPANAADEERAAKILEALRPAIEKYKDYKVAMADGYQIFLPNLPQKQYHFTNWRYAVRAIFTFDPTRPTSLLYNKVDGGYALAGAMYTAPKRFTEDQLNERVPLSVARWHKHVNFCMPPKGMSPGQVDWKEFGQGSIVTEEACSAAGGRWMPEIFNWMVHVYPYEKDPEKVWAH